MENVTGVSGLEIAEICILYLKDYGECPEENQ